MFVRRTAVISSLVLLLAAVPGSASANHSWGGYHWARTSNPFTLGLGDNVSNLWDPYLSAASTDWSVSSVLDTTVVPGGTRARPCKAADGHIEICNTTYGNTGWLGVAQIWVSGLHITRGTVKLNDTYFNTATYNTSSWRRLVVCQEVGHTFGLDHQDETFDNPNLGTCMDYTSNPDGPPSNLQPNQHDYDELAIIYAHLDTTTTIASTTTDAVGGGNSASEWGVAIRTSSDGRASLYVREVLGGYVFTFVTWA